MMRPDGATRPHPVKQGAVYLLFFLVIIVFAYPIYFPLVSSFKSTEDIFTSPFSLPSSLDLYNYVKAWDLAHIGRAFANSLVLSGSTVLVTLIAAAMGAYVIARFTFRFQSGALIYFLIGLMIPIQSTIIPLTYMIAKIDLTSNLLVVVMLFVTTNLPLAIFILNGFMGQIPASLEESAIMDGASAIDIFIKVMLPLTVPALATVGIFVFMQSWNDLLIPLIFIQEQQHQTISIGLISFKGQYSSDYGTLMAAIVIAILPPLLVYIAAQEKVQSGLTAGAVKG
ncbi:carbohydrate ABC transporter permease [Paenibacillus sp. GCM10023252]|uniref:carbohydrate ABC transporter permease n=1 Tax=Paenibacillus sp. GCM10023252 TaxID=3252649 RepID=UPI0036108B8F